MEHHRRDPLSIYIEASFWPNWDGAWHQTLVRDTALTPTHIPMFYFFFPLSVVLALGAYLYGMYADSRAVLAATKVSRGHSSF